MNTIKPLFSNGLLSRRDFVSNSAKLSLLASMPVLAKSKPLSPQLTAVSHELAGEVIDLTIAEKSVNITGKNRLATTVNGSMPGPIIRLKEGQKITINVHNQLAEDTSIHWHGLILASNMDGVPGLSFHGISPNDTFQYQFDVKQNGTYWYHSHSGWQEQTGVYGAIVIDPIEPEPFLYDRDYVVLLSDWSDEHPETVFHNLKKQSHFYNVGERSIQNNIDDIKTKGIKQTWRDRKMWNTMRMSDSDISDVTAYTYSYLMNGNNHKEGWEGLFKLGEKIRLRFINASAMTFFDIRIPGLKMTIVAADGQLVKPVSVDEFRIANAETYDVIVEPDKDAAYTLFAQAIDRSGYACGTLTTANNKKAIIPAMDAVPKLTHIDMGMDMDAEDHSAHKGMNMDMPMEGMDHSQHMTMKPKMGDGLAGFGSALPVIHSKTELGSHVDMRAASPQYRLDDPGIGLRDHAEKLGRKVLTYAMLKSYYPTQDKRQPSREIQLHLTGNMYRYQWSINGVASEKAAPIELEFGERVRITLINDTMMNHPIHLHGMWSELETGDAEYIPRKHTIISQPGSKTSYLVTADAKGDWAYHCHLLYHMAEMFRVVRVK
jgi:CopA family copper-resistance protein